MWSLWADVNKGFSRLFLRNQQRSPVHRLVSGEAGEGGEGFGAFTGSGRFDAIVCWCKEYSVVILVDLSWKKVRWR